MSPLACDPVTLVECTVIVLFGGLDIWWFLPAQRRKRRRVQARERALLRLLVIKSTVGAEANARTPSPICDQQGRK